MAKAVIGGGCFWCLDAIFSTLKGVKNVKTGYAGGRRKNPTYEQVCTGVTGHAEVVCVEFDRSEISYREILDVFFKIHDPTQLNRQGNDVGTQYRSVILYTDEEQKNIAMKKLEELKKAGVDAVTEVKRLDEFYEAEEYHQKYFFKNPEAPYCMYVIYPKLEKFKNEKNKNA